VRGHASRPAVAVVESPDEHRARAFLDELDELDAADRPSESRPATVVLHTVPDARGATARVVHAVASAHELTRGLAGALLADVPAEYRRQLSLAALLGYVHERLHSFEPLLPDVATRPWSIPLEGGWFQVDPAWRPALAAQTPGPLPVSAVARVVGDLVDMSAPEEALEFCLDAACPGLASDLLAELAPGLVAADRSSALQRWLTRLPPQEQARHAPLLARLGLPDVAGVVPAPRPPIRQLRWWPQRRRLSAPPQRRASRRPPEPAGPRAGPASGGLVETPRARPDPLTVSVRLLGAVEVLLDGRKVEHWHGRVGRTALAYVLLQRRRVPPDELAGAIWPDVPATTARNRLHVALHRLRADLAAVDPRPVLVHEQGYAVDPDVRVDLDTDRFERLADAGDEAFRGDDAFHALTAYLAALDCYGGELLAGERDDEWALLSREHYRVRLLDVLGKAAHLAFDLDRPALAVDLGQRLLALDFCREDLHRLLMRAYARLGQPQLALRQYQTCVRQLRLEFGLDPAPATVELFDQVRCQVPV
jgi:DNA-binding SARP family transcriptional activator